THIGEPGMSAPQAREPVPSDTLEHGSRLRIATCVDVQSGEPTGNVERMVGKGARACLMECSKRVVDLVMTPLLTTYSRRQRDARDLGSGVPSSLAERPRLLDQTVGVVEIAAPQRTHRQQMPGYPEIADLAQRLGLGLELIDVRLQSQGFG